MSGPKSTRYTLTLEQRRILIETRERDRKTQLEKQRFQQIKAEITELKNTLLCSIRNVDILVERTGLGKNEQKILADAISNIDVQIDKINSIPSTAELEVLQQYNLLSREVIQSGRITRNSYEKKKENVTEELTSSINDSIVAGMIIRIDEQIEEPLSKNEEIKEKIAIALNAVRQMNLNTELFDECKEIFNKAQQINSEDFMENYYAITITPFVKKCHQYEEQSKQFQEEFEELVSKYRFYSTYLELPVVEFKFDIYIMDSLRKEVEELEKKYEYLEEQKYIADSFDEVMKDMGYCVIGSSKVIKKSGRKFRNELYYFSEGTVINVTHAANGQITMELGGVDTCDREPNLSESSVLYKEMVEFCDEFHDVEKRLKEKGIILDSRISMLPPSEEYAQIINVNDYDMKENIEIFRVTEKKQRENQIQVMRKER